jgi:hypothetical protein
MVLPIATHSNKSKIDSSEKTTFPKYSADSNTNKQTSELIGLILLGAANTQSRQVLREPV